MGRIFLSRVYSSKNFLSFVIFIALMLYLFGGLLIYQNEISGYEAYILFSNSNANRFLWLFFAVISMQFPHRDPHIIIRTGKNRWLINEIISLVMTIFIFNIVIAIFCIMCFGVKSATDWNLDFILFYENGGNWLDAKTGAVGDFSGWVIFHKPYEAFLVSFMYVFLCGVITGLICLVFNMFNKYVYGPCVCVLLYFSKYIYGFLQAGTTKYLYTELGKIYEIGQLPNISLAFLGGKFNLTAITIWYIIIILILLLILEASKKHVEVT